MSHRRISWKLATGALLGVVLTGCGGGGSATPLTNETTTTPTRSVKTTSAPAKTPTAPAETTTATPALTSDDLAAGLLSPGEMEFVLNATGSAGETTLRGVATVDGCGGLSASSAIEPVARHTGTYTTDAMQLFTAYLGYYPGHAEEMLAATVPDGCTDFTSIVSDTQFPVTATTAPALPPTAPANSRLLTFSVDGQPYEAAVAYVQMDDFVLCLYHVGPAGGVAVGMSDYLSYTLDRFTRFVGDQ